jgi:hypothetical protein
MTKNVTTLLVLGAVGVGAYLILKPKKKNMVGFTNGVGKRNLVNARTINVKKSKWYNADGNFFKVKSTRF